MDNIKLVKYKIKEINKVLEPSEQRIELSEEKITQEDTPYRDLTWYRPASKDAEIEEHVFGGDDWELICVLLGIEYGIRMTKAKENKQNGVLEN